MNLTNAWLIALAGLTAAGLIAWAWIAVTRVMDELGNFNNFEGMHFER